MCIEYYIPAAARSTRQNEKRNISSFFLQPKGNLSIQRILGKLIQINVNAIGDAQNEHGKTTTHTVCCCLLDLPRLFLFPRLQPATKHGLQLRSIWSEELENALNFTAHISIFILQNIAYLSNVIDKPCVRKEGIVEFARFLSSSAFPSSLFLPAYAGFRCLFHLFSNVCLSFQTINSAEIYTLQRQFDDFPCKQIIFIQKHKSHSLNQWVPSSHLQSI